MVADCSILLAKTFHVKTFSVWGRNSSHGLHSGGLFLVPFALLGDPGLHSGGLFLVPFALLGDRGLQSDVSRVRSHSLRVLPPSIGTSLQTRATPLECLR